MAGTRKRVLVPGKRKAAGVTKDEVQKEIRAKQARKRVGAGVKKTPALSSKPKTYKTRKMTWLAVGKPKKWR